MSFLASVKNLKLRSSDNRRRNHIEGPRMDHHSGMDALKDATLQHLNLAASVANLLGGCP